MDFDPVQKIYDLINSTYVDPGDDKSGGLFEMESFIRKTEFISLFFHLLKRTDLSIHHIFISYTCIYSIIENRGSLLSVSLLEKLFELTLASIQENSVVLLQNGQLLYKAVSVCSIIMKIYFEMKNELDNFFNSIKEIYDTDENGQVISLTIMASLPEVFVKIQNYTDQYDTELTCSKFKDKYIINLINIAFEAIFSSEHLVSHGLYLLRNALFFCEQKSYEGAVVAVQFPNSMQSAFDSAHCEKLFSLLSTTEQNAQQCVLEILNIYLKPTKIMFSSIPLISEFILQAFTLTTTIMSESNITDPLFPGICNLVSLVCQLQIRLDGQVTEQTMPFINQLYEFTNNALNASISVYEQIIEIWTNFLSWKFNDVPAEVLDQITQSLHQFLQNFFGGLFNQINRFAETIYEENLLESKAMYSNIWKLTKIDFDSLSKMISDIIMQKKAEIEASQTPQVALAILFIIRLIRARKSAVRDFETSDNNIIYAFYDRSLQLVCSLTPLLEGIISVCGDLAVDLEKEIVGFLQEFCSILLDKYQDSMAKGMSDTEMKTRLESLGDKQLEDWEIEQMKTHVMIEAANVAEENVKNNFESVLEFIFTSISAFCNCGLQTSSSVIIQLIMLLSAIMNNSKTSVLFAHSKFFESVNKRQINIDFNAQNMKILKRPRSSLFYFYANHIPNHRVLLQFLGTYHERFEFLQTNTDPIGVIALYRDLTSMVTGLTNYSYLEKMLTWFCNNHLEDTMNFIANFSNDIFVLKSIIRLYIAIYKTSRVENAPHVLEGTGLGIFLVKTSARIIETLFSYLSTNPDIIMILAKLFHSCLITRTVNYGVMRHYNDFSIDLITQKFYQTLEYGNSLGDNPVLYRYLLITLTSIAENCPEDFSKIDNIKMTIQFTSKPLNSDSIELFKIAYLVISQVLSHDITALIPMLRHHFVYVFNAIINSSEHACAFPLLIYMVRFDSEFVKEAVNQFIMAYDEEFRNDVSKNVQTLLGADPNDESAPKTFYRVMRKYQIYLNSIEFFRQFYEG